jgi:aminopeptidase
MPLSYAGTPIEGMGLRFEGGRAVEAWAERGQEVLEGILDSDDGARRLGEVALVAESSPIARAKLLFLNTLFDENAACHLALGRGFPFCLDGWQQQDDGAIAAAGINASLVHVDFMIGSDRLDIDGVTAEGGEEAIMRAGEWAF